MVFTMMLLPRLSEVLRKSTSLCGTLLLLSVGSQE
jgi:hypothetical protein